MNRIDEENNPKRFVADNHEYKFKINGKTENIAKEMELREKNEISTAMEKYMPIGSIIKIKQSFKKYMIIGFKCKSDGVDFDYLACEYPFGLNLQHSTSTFNHEDIEKVFHIGFVNNQEKQFKSQLKGVQNGELDR